MGEMDSVETDCINIKSGCKYYEDLKSALNMLDLNNLTKILPRLAATHIK